MIDVGGIVIGAFAMLALVGMVRRLFFGPAVRVRGGPAGVQGLGGGVHGVGDWSPPGVTVVIPTPVDRAASPRRVQGETPEKPKKSVANPAPRTVQMGVGDQVRSFVAWMLEDGGPVRLTDKRTVANYQRWAEQWNVLPIPASILLATLKEHPHVLHKRDRLLDATGKAVRNENGTPIRPTYYTFGATKKAKAKAPGKVPVLELVPHDPLASRPKFEAPERIAA